MRGGGYSFTPLFLYSLENNYARLMGNDKQFHSVGGSTPLGLGFTYDD